MYNGDSFSFTQRKVLEIMVMAARCGTLLKAPALKHGKVLSITCVHPPQFFVSPQDKIKSTRFSLPHC